MTYTYNNVYDMCECIRLYTCRRYIILYTSRKKRTINYTHPPVTILYIYIAAVGTYILYHRRIIIHLNGYVINSGIARNIPAVYPGISHIL